MSAGQKDVRAPSAIDRRRLNDGAAALERSAQRPETIAEVRVQLSIVGEGIAALQSLDDLGPGGNARAMRDQEELWARHRALKKQLVELEGGG